MYRTSEYRRHQRKRVINRKKHIIHEQNDYWNYKHEGCLDKGKIHCSCWMCSAKTGVHGWKMGDLKNLMGMKKEADDYGVVLHNCKY